MVGLEFLVMVCLCTTLTASPNLSNDKNETAILRQQLKQLEETVSDLKKHMLAQEQKQAAVLSSVLSRLTETSEELEKQQNYTELEFTSLRENYSSLGGAGKSLTGLEVAFEANMARKGENNKNAIPIKANSTLIFSTTQYNEGGCWNSSTGVFTATMNGTYMFWIDLTFTKTTFFTLYIKRNDADFGKAFARVYNRETDMMSLISLTPLVESDRVQFVADKHIECWPLLSSCGGVRLY